MPLIAISGIFLAVMRHRDHNLGGVIRFWQALVIGLGISLVAGIFYVAAWRRPARSPISISPILMP
jgi:hypothetical protein